MQYEASLNRKDKIIQRIFEIIPGVLTWLAILSPIWLGLLFPKAVVFVLTVLTLYWSYKAIISTLGLVLGYPKYQKEMNEDWYKNCMDLEYSSLPDKDTLPPTFEDVKHFILIPCVNEPYEVLRDSFNSYLNQTFPTKKITLVYTVEEKPSKKTIETIKKIILPHKEKFDEILIFKHPAGIPNEAIGVGGANRTWGARNAVDFLKKKGNNMRNYIFSSFDADHIPDKQYMARLTHLYLTTDKRDNHFYATTMHLFNNNHWDVPSMARIEANFVTLGTLAGRSVPWGLSTLTVNTFAAYSLSMQTLIDADYWDVQLGIDDTIFYWRAFDVRNGDFKMASHYIPYSADAVQGKNYWHTHVSLYKQLLRWGWGVIEVPLSAKIMIKNKKIPFSKKILWAYHHFKTRIVMYNTVFLITFGFALLTLFNPAVRQSSVAYSLPNTMSWLLSLTLVFLVPPTYYRSKIVPPKPENWSWWKKFLVNFEAVVIMINLLTFSFIPFVDAHTRMMLGKKMKDLYHTPKYR